MDKIFLRVKPSVSWLWNRLIDLSSKDLFFPAIMLIWGSIYIFFGEKLPANWGLGWDGLKYAQLTRELFYSPILDTYLVQRMFPPMLVRTALDLLSLALSNTNIIHCFEVINLISLVVATYVIKLTLNELRVAAELHYLAFSLFLLTYPVAKGLFYYPVLTDAPAICLGALLLYFYLKDQLINLILAIVIASFTLPLLLYLGVLLVAFPRQKSETVEPTDGVLLLLSLSGVCFIGGIIYYWIFEFGASVDYPYSLQVDPHLLYASIFLACVPYYFIPRIVADRRFITLSYWLKTIYVPRLIVAALLFLVIRYLGAYLNFDGKCSGYLTHHHILSSLAVAGIVRPAIFLSSHFSYFGLVVVFLYFFWASFCRKVLSFGPGLATSLFLVLVMFGINSQARVINCVLPWFVVLITYAVTGYKFSRFFLVLVAITNFVVSRAWLPVRYNKSPTNYDGTIGFPNQKLLMNYGLWVSEEVWLVQLLVMMVVFVCFAYSLFRFRIEGNEIVLVKEYYRI